MPWGTHSKLRHLNSRQASHASVCERNGHCLYTQSRPSKPPFPTITLPPSLPPSLPLSLHQSLPPSLRPSPLHIDRTANAPSRCSTSSLAALESQWRRRWARGGRVQAQARGGARERVRRRVREEETRGTGEKGMGQAEYQRRRSGRLQGHRPVWASNRREKAEARAEKSFFVPSNTGRLGARGLRTPCVPLGFMSNRVVRLDH